MPVEYLIFKDRPAPLSVCPRCGAAPFDPFLRGQIKSVWRGFWGRPSWCLICARCKEIVGYEKV